MPVGQTIDLASVDSNYRKITDTGRHSGPIMVTVQIKQILDHLDRKVQAQMSIGLRHVEESKCPF